MKNTDDRLSKYTYTCACTKITTAVTVKCNLGPSDRKILVKKSKLLRTDSLTVYTKKTQWLITAQKTHGLNDNSRASNNRNAASTRLSAGVVPFTVMCRRHFNCVPKRTNVFRLCPLRLLLIVFHLQELSRFSLDSVTLTRSSWSPSSPVFFVFIL